MTELPAGASTRHACVIGWPIEHSRSPMVHGHWLETLGIDGTYTKRAVAPDDLGSFLDEIRSGALAGCNVTIPHKEAVLPLLDDVLPEARALGAVNTVWREGDRLVGTSTDGVGFLAHLDDSAPDWRKADGTVLIIGAGGAARAIAYVLRNEVGGDIVVTNRTPERAAGLVEMLAAGGKAGSSAEAVDWSARHNAVGDARLIINTTALGMTGKPPLDLDLGRARVGTVVADIVYAPLETALLADARRQGLVTVDGLGMLLHQAVPGFEKWFGVRPKVTAELRDVIVRDLTSADP
jgi:shikimate dehydrogenase